MPVVTFYCCHTEGFPIIHAFMAEFVLVWPFALSRPGAFEHFFCRVVLLSFSLEVA